MSSWQDAYDRSTADERARLKEGDSTPAFSGSWWLWLVVVAVVGGVGGWVRTGAERAELVAIPITGTAVFVLAVVVNVLLRRRTRRPRAEAPGSG